MNHIVCRYSVRVIEAAQQLNECVNLPGGLGKAIIGNSEIKILFGVQEQDIEMS